MTCIVCSACVKYYDSWTVVSRWSAVDSLGPVARWRSFAVVYIFLKVPSKSTGRLLHAFIQTAGKKNYVVAMVASTATDMTGSIYHERQVIYYYCCILSVDRPYIALVSCRKPVTVYNAKHSSMERSIDGWKYFAMFWKKKKMLF